MASQVNLVRVHRGGKGEMEDDGKKKDRYRLHEEKDVGLQSLGFAIIYPTRLF